MHASRDPQPQCDTESGTAPTQFEVGRKCKEEQDQSALDHVDRLLEDVNAGDDPINVVLRRVSGSYRRQEYKNHTDPTDEQFAKSGQGRI